MSICRFAWLAIVLSVATSMTSPARASLIEMGIFSRDQATGLDWLDLTQTVRLSYGQVAGGEGGWISQGWRYATETEVRAFLTRYAGSSDGAEAANPELTRFLEFVGATVEPPELTYQSRAYGLYDDSMQAPYDLYAGRADIFLTYLPGYPASITWVASNDMQLYHDSNRAVGSFLVRPFVVSPGAVPEPTMPALLVAALVSLGVHTRAHSAHSKMPKPG